MEIAVDLGSLIKDTKIGDSISINGVCLTVTSIAGSIANFDVSGETLEKSAISLLKISDKVNTERAMLAGTGSAAISYRAISMEPQPSKKSQNKVNLRIPICSGSHIC